MRSFAEEKKGGTLELLLTKPITETHLILGKYLANFTLVLFTQRLKTLKRHAGKARVFHAKMVSDITLF